MQDAQSQIAVLVRGRADHDGARGPNALEQAQTVAVGQPHIEQRRVKWRAGELDARLGE